MQVKIWFKNAAGLSWEMTGKLICAGEEYVRMVSDLSGNIVLYEFSDKEFEKLEIYHLT